MEKLEDVLKMVQEEFEAIIYDDAVVYNNNKVIMTLRYEVYNDGVGGGCTGWCSGILAKSNSNNEPIPAEFGMSGCYSYSQTARAEFDSHKHLSGTWWKPAVPYNQIGEAIKAFDDYKKEQAEKRGE